MSDPTPTLTDEQREKVAEALTECDELAFDNIHADWARRSVADSLASLIARMVADAEQRGREDNADHGQCYPHGSRALDARLAAAKAEALREVAEAMPDCTEPGAFCPCDALMVIVRHKDYQPADEIGGTP